MKEVMNTVLILCTSLIAAEVIAKFAPNSNIIGFVKQIIFVVLVLSVIAAVTKSDFSFNMENNFHVDTDNELIEYINEQYENTASVKTAEYIKGLLGSISIETNNIEVFTDIDSEKNISIIKVTVELKYESDRERSIVLLKRMLDEGIEIEVK